MGKARRIGLAKISRTGKTISILLFNEYWLYIYLEDIDKLKNGEKKTTNVYEASGDW